MDARYRLIAKAVNLASFKKILMLWNVLREKVNFKIDVLPFQHSPSEILHLIKVKFNIQVDTEVFQKGVRVAFYGLQYFL